MDWEAEYRRLLPRIYNFFRYRVGDDTIAEDLTAATFEKAWRSRALYRHDRGEFEGWIIGIARNLAADYWRSKRPSLTSLDVLPDLPGGDNVEGQVAHEWEIAQIGALLESLPDDERELIALKYGAGLNNREIARIAGKTESNVGTTLYRIIRKLRSAWETHYA